MKKFLTKTILFSACIICIVVGLLMIPNTELLVGLKKVYLEKSENKNYDLLILGSSRALHTFKPDMYTGNLNIFNEGEDGQGFPSNYLMLKVLVDKYHLKVSRVLLQVDEFSFKGETEFARQFRDDYFITDIEEPEVFDAFKRYRGNIFSYTIRLFPKLGNLVYCDFYKLVRNEIISMRKIIPSLNKVYQGRLDKAVAFKGYLSLSTFPNVKSTEHSFDLEEDDIEYFNKLMSFCKSRNIEVFLYRAPIWDCQVKKSDPFDQYIKTFSDANGIKFFDYKCKYQWPGFYMDQNHPADSISSRLTMDLLRDMKMINR